MTNNSLLTVGVRLLQLIWLLNITRQNKYCHVALSRMSTAKSDELGEETSVVVKQKHHSNCGVKLPVLMTGLASRHGRAVSVYLCTIFGDVQFHQLHEVGHLRWESLDLIVTQP